MKPRETKPQRIDMLMATQTARMDENYGIKVTLTSVDKSELLSLNNPDYNILIERYQNLE